MADLEQHLDEAFEQRVARGICAQCPTPNLCWEAGRCLNSPEVADVLRRPDEMMRRL